MVIERSVCMIRIINYRPVLAQKAVFKHWFSNCETLILIPINNTPTVIYISSYVGNFYFENLLEINLVLIPLFLIPINNTPTVSV